MKPWERDWSVAPKPWERQWDAAPTAAPRPAHRPTRSTTPVVEASPAPTPPAAAQAGEAPIYPVAIGRGAPQPEYDMTMPLLADARGVPSMPAAPQADMKPWQRAWEGPGLDDSLGGLFARRGQQFMEGLADFVARQPEAAAVRGANVDLSQTEEAAELFAERAAMIGEMEARLLDPALAPEEREFIERNLADLRIGQEELARRAEAEVVPYDERAAHALGDTIRQASAGIFGEPDRRDTGLWGKVATGAGTFGGNILATLAGGLVGGPPGALAAGGFTAASANQAQVYDEAIAFGADPETARRASRFGAAVGAGEVIPIFRALKYVPSKLRGKVANRVAARGLEILKAGGEEAAQEFAAQVLNNAIAIGENYDPNRNYLEGAGEAALIGAILGGGLGAVAPSSPADMASRVPDVPEPPTSDAPTPDAPPDAPAEAAPVFRTTRQEMPVEPTPEAAPTPDAAAPPVADGVDQRPRVADVVPEPPRPQARPLTATVRRDGIRIDPQSPAGRELQAGGVTPQSTPGLFARGGQTDLDNLVAEEYPELRDLVGTDDGGVYLNQRGLIDALINEANNRPVQNAEQAAAQAAYDEYQRTANEIYQEYQEDGVLGSIVVQPPSESIEVGAERIATVTAAYEQAVVEMGNPVVSPEMRRAIIQELDERGGDVEVAIYNAIVREVDDVEATGTRRVAEGEGAARVAEPGDQRRGPETPPIRDDASGRAGERTEYETTPEGEQAVIPGTREDGITEAEDRARREAAVQAQQSKIRRAGQERVEDDPGGLFGPQQGDIFDQPQDTDEAEGQGDLRRDDDGQAMDKTDVGTKPGRRPPGKLTPKFLKFSWNNKPSVYNAAFRDAGVDPEVARMKDLEWQLETLSNIVKDRYGIDVRVGFRMVERKNLLGRKVSVQSRDLTHRKAIDQLLDAYQTLEMLAAILHVPTEALSLPIDGKPLTLELTNKKRMRGALGMFAYGGDRRVIYMPDRSNSFAHEWGHALDHYMTTQVDHPLMAQMLTREMSAPEGRQQPNLSFTHPKRPLTDAMTMVLRAMFGDTPMVGAVRLRLEIMAAQTDANGNPTPSAQEAQRALDAAKKGAPVAQKYLTDYFKNSKEFDEASSAGGYFTDPAEMFARAFEAWVGRTVGRETDAPQNFLSKGAWAYETDADARLDLTFPKGVDADTFAVAMTRLTRALVNVADLPPGQAPVFPKDPPRVKPILIRKKASDRHALSQWFADDVKRIKGLVTNIINGPAALTTRKPQTEQRLTQLFMRQVINSGSGSLHDIARTYEGEARKAIDNIAKRIGTRPGYGQLTGETFQLAWESWAHAHFNRINREVENTFGQKDIPSDYWKPLRRALFGQTAGIPEKVQKLARIMNQITDQIWYDLDSVGLEPGYQRGYLPHVYHRGKIDNDQEGFKAAAANVYRLMFKREVIDQKDPAEQWADIRRAMVVLDNDMVGTAEGTYEPRSYLTPEIVALFDAIREERRTVSRAKSALKKAVRKDTAEKHKAAIAEAEARIREMTDELLPMIQDQWAKYSAVHWHNAMGVGQINDFDTMGPTANFLQARRFPPEAADMLSKYMVDDPRELLQGYIFQASRKYHYAKLFGAPTEESPEGGELKAMLQKARDENVTEADIDNIKTAVNAATGRMSGELRGVVRTLGRATAYGQMALLTLAPLSSLAEPLVLGLRTGKVRDSFAAVVSHIRILASSERRHELYDLALSIGMIADYTAETIMANRMATDAMSLSDRDREIIAKFHNMTGLIPLTNFQRVANVPVAHHVVLRLLRDSVKGKRSSRARDFIAGGAGKFADGELNELGIEADKRAAFLEWMEGLNGVPRQEDLMDNRGVMHPAGHMWSLAMRRLTGETIQNTQKSDRAIAANSPYIAPMYSIMSFIDGFHRHIILRTLRRGVSEDAATLSWERLWKGGANIGLATVPAGMLYAGHLLSTVIREALLNADKLDDMEDDEIVEYMLTRAFHRAGLTGRFDPLIQAATGVKYENDLTGMIAGPHNSFFLGQVQTVLEAAFGRNSANTNTAEWNAAQSVYRGLVHPLAARIVVGLVPSGGAVGLLGTTALYSLGRYDTSKEFATGVVGEKGRKYDKEGMTSSPWFEMGDAFWRWDDD